jgi:hypothetical protein
LFGAPRGSRLFCAVHESEDGANLPFNDAEAPSRL